MVNCARPGEWGNPFKVKNHGAPEAVRLYASYLSKGKLHFTKEDARLELHGKNLACWCKPWEFCHADVLLQIANA